MPCIIGQWFLHSAASGRERIELKSQESEGGIEANCPLLIPQCLTKEIGTKFSGVLFCPQICRAIYENAKWQFRPCSRTLSWTSFPLSWWNLGGTKAFKKNRRTRISNPKQTEYSFSFPCYTYLKYSMPMPLIIYNETNQKVHFILLYYFNHVFLFSTFQILQTFKHKIFKFARE